MQKQIYVHIGLPKTATTYLQTAIFPKFASEKVCVFPIEIQKYLRNFLYTKTTKMNKDSEIYLLEKIKNSLSKIKQKKIIISCEWLSMTGYCPYYECNLRILKKIFPKARIIIILRKQCDWAISCYRQSVHQGNPQKIENFFIVSDKKINNFSNFYENGKVFPQLDLYASRWIFLVRDYYKNFGSNNVYVAFYEDLKENKSKFVYNLCVFIDISIPEKIPDKIVYKGLSGLAIKASIILWNLSKKIGIQIPYSSSNFFTWIRWRALWQNIIDKIIYVDFWLNESKIFKNSPILKVWEKDYDQVKNFVKKITSK